MDKSWWYRWIADVSGAHTQAAIEMPLHSIHLRLHIQDVTSICAITLQICYNFASTRDTELPKDSELVPR
jgi:hypothetical protein